MSGFVSYAIIYAISGLLLAVLMFLTAGRIKAVGTSAGTALTIDLGKWKLETGSVIVALGFLSLVAMIAIPAYYLYLNSKVDDTPLTLTVPFDPSETITVDTGSETFSGMKTPQITFYKTKTHQTFAFEGSKTEVPFQIEVWFEPVEKVAMVSVRHGQAKPYPNLALPLMRFDRASQPGSQTGPGTLTKPPAANRDERLSDPQPIAQARGSATSLAGGSVP
ncbi:MAG TPA: hypothetical protein VN909_05705 [Candidatus Dormibacteraeota bacterium]|nr:hypothetical protein [Candidatus Dormibacteraeota bacterium]